MRRALRWMFLSVVALPILSGGALFALIELSLPDLDGEHAIPGLSAPAEIAYDGRGIPRIQAANRDDAFAALGFATAMDRLFQMDLLRRGPAGRLAEVFGESLVSADRQNRVLNLERVAREALARLPAAQRSALRSYVAGVNRAIAEIRVWPIEFYVLGYRPEPWRAEDSLLVLLGLEQAMSETEEQERTATVMRRALPPEVLAFLTPEADCFNERLAPRDDSHCSAGAAPVDALASLYRSRGKRAAEERVSRGDRRPGSNAFAVSGRKTKDGRAILANDMHLTLSVPNLWYRAELYYGEARLAGLTLPGTPMLLTGSNGRVAWGFTNLRADVDDLVMLTGVAGEADKYLTPEGPRGYDIRTETLGVRGAPSVAIEIEETIWGPVAPRRLLGERVAYRSAALDPATTDLALLDLDGVRSVEEAAALFRRAGGPPLNALIADDRGEIGWTVLGHLPKRFGMEGLFSESWADGARGWRGYLAPDELPFRLDPSSGFLVNTNQRMLSRAEFGPVLGHEYLGGFRAWRATEVLSRARSLTEADLLALQLDTDASYYAPYRDLALKALRSAPPGGDNENVAAIRSYLEAWDGRAETGSLGLPLLEEFRDELRESVLAPIMARCRELDPEFSLSWSMLDDPVRRIIETGRPELLPDATQGDWNGFLLAALIRSARRLQAQQGATMLSELKWGRVNTVEMAHTLSSSVPFLNIMLDMPRRELAGCIFCVRVSEDTHGANARMVVAPGREAEGLMQFAGGQSGQVGSSHYADQQEDWRLGRPAPFLSREAQHKMILRPAS